MTPRDSLPPPADSGQPDQRPAPVYVMMPQDYPYGMDDEISLLTYVNVLLKRRWLLVFLTLLAAAAAYGYSKMQTPVYQSRATFLVADRASTQVVGQLEDGRLFDLRDPVPYYRQLAVSGPLLDRVLKEDFVDPATGRSGTYLDVLTARIEGDPGWSEADRLAAARRSLADWIGLSNERTSPNVVNLTVTAPSPDLAAGLANTLMETLRSYDVELRLENVQSRVRFMEAQLEETEGELKQAEAALESFLRRNRLASSPQVKLEQSRLERELSIQEDLFKTLRREYEVARIVERREVSSVSVIDQATPPRAPSRPRTRVNVLLGAVVGFMIAVGWAFVSEFVGSLSPGRTVNREFQENLHAIRNDLRRMVLLKPKPLESPGQNLLDRSQD